MNCKYSHSRRVMLKHPKLRKKLTNDDLENGFKRFNKYKKKKKERVYYKVCMYS